MKLKVRDMQAESKKKTLENYYLDSLEVAGRAK